ncbi:MAG: hypothetical protein BGN87_13070 [Rhizobiales bacterium 65-79]|nr:MAG: hypothetical protein BGN87_13070 [Rhizobiales bacterium 65-79]
MTNTLIFPECKVAYIPVPKAACTSIKTALLPLVGEEARDDFLVHLTDKFDIRPFSECRPLLSPEWFVFTVVRHPIDRALSAWRNKCDPAGPGLTGRMHKMGFRPGDDLDAFTKTLSRWPAQAMDEHVMPQSDLLDGIDRWPVQVFKFETLKDDWPAIVREIRRRGGQISDDLPMRNVSSQRVGDSRQAMERLNRIYRDDFARYSY